MKIVIISFFLVVNYTSWNQVTIHRFQDFFFWEFQKKPATTPHLLAFPLHVPGHCAWEPTHHLDCQLELPHTHPHNFFLSNLSFLDICFISNSIPKILWNIQTQSKGVTYEGCITQMYFSILFVGWDNFLLASMACVHFFAICHPLHYNIILNPQLCGLLMLVSWILSVLNSLLQSLMML